MAEVALPADGKLDYGRVWRDTLSVTGKRPVFVLGLAFLLSGVEVIIRPVVGPGRRALEIFHPPGLMHLLVMALLNAFLTACLYRLSVRELEGQTPSPNEVFSTGGRLFLPLFAVTLLACLGIAGGVLLLIVPGVMLAMAWLVAGPALVQEQTGITQSFGRSAQLTRGNRWRLFGLCLLFVIGAAIVQAIFEALGFVVSVGERGLFAGPRLLGSAILSTLFTALITPGVAAIYVQLRELRGG